MMHKLRGPWRNMRDPSSMRWPKRRGRNTARSRPATARARGAPSGHRRHLHDLPDVLYVCRGHLSGCRVHHHLEHGLPALRPCSGLVPGPARSDRLPHVAGRALPQAERALKDRPQQGSLLFFYQFCSTNVVNIRFFRVFSRFQQFFNLFE